MAVLVLLRLGDREAASRILLALAEAQYADGTLPFNLHFSREAPPPYVRSGALAWVGYAAAEYLDADRSGSNRAAIVTMAHRIAAYLLAHRVGNGGGDGAADAREGFITAGRGSFLHRVVGRDVVEVFEDGERDFASIEHAVDAIFFFRAFARVTGDARHRIVADELAHALVTKAWDEERGQFVRGITKDGPDRTFALDCASWGGLVLLAIGDRARATRCLAEADSRYRSTSKTRDAVGHKPYATGFVIESWALRQQAPPGLRTAEWPSFATVWPEGSAGVALLATRLGQIERAKAICDALEPLRNADGSLPTATDPVPHEIDTLPSIAGTGWVEIVRHELATRRATFWI